jgi:hypothetical protein
MTRCPAALPSAPVVTAAIAAIALGLALLGAAAPLRDPAPARAAPARSTAANPPDLAVAGQAGGHLFAQAPFAGRLGNRLYLAAGPRIVVYDVSDPTAPVYAGQSEALPGFATHLAIESTKLYAAIPAAGLFILDIGDRLNPEILGLVPSVGYEITGLEVDGGHAFVADAQIGLQIFDVQNPKQARLVDVLVFKAAPDAAKPMPIEHLTRNDTDLLVIAKDPANRHRHGLITMSAVDPTLVRELGRVFFEGFGPVIFDPAGVAWIGNFAYVTAPVILSPSPAAILIFDLTRPESPEARGQIDLTGQGLNPDSVIGTPTRLYVSAISTEANNTTTLIEYDLADPAAPREVARHEDGPWGALAIANQTLYSMASPTVGVYDIRTSPSPARLGTILTIGYVRDAAADRVHAYLLTADAIWTVRLDDPSKVVSRWPTPWTGVRMAIRGDKLLVAAGGDGLRVVYMADPTSPRELAGLSVGAGQWLGAIAIPDARAAAGVAAVGRGASGVGPIELWTVDLTPPDGPTKLGSTSVAISEDWSGDLAVAGSAAMMTAGSTLIAVDIHDPSAPREAGRTTLPSKALALAGGGSRTAYVGLSGSIRAFEVSNPAEMRETAVLDAGSASGQPRRVYGLGWQADRLYALLAYFPYGPEGHTATLRSIKVEPDGKLSVIDGVDIAGGSSGLLPQGRYILVAGGFAGLTEVRRASGRGVFADAYMPIASPAGRE